MAEQDKPGTPPAPPKVPDRINLVEQSGEWGMRGQKAPYTPYDFVCGHIAAKQPEFVAGMVMPLEPSFLWEVKDCDGKRVLFCTDCVRRYDAGAELVVQGRPQPRT